MNCDFSDLRQETINYNGVNLENLYFSCIFLCISFLSQIRIPDPSSNHGRDKM